VTRRIEDGICWITLNRPDAGNAMTQFMRDQIAAWVRDASSDLFVRVVVITAVGDKAFCSGADLRGGRLPPRPRPDDAPETDAGSAARMIRDGWQALVASIIDCEKPVIAGVNGTAAGGGMHLALACDLVVMAEEAKFVEVFIRRGIAPDAGGAWILTRLVGLQKAKELFFFGDDVPAAEAYRIGLVNRLVARDQLQGTLEELAGRLAQGPTKAIGMAKWLTNRALDVDRTTSFHDEALAQELITTTFDMKEGVASFVERRPAAFKGW
jgi:2-(1,2-epoxy-1,2-dihydrophenyl)acetyl-CoA isomerase